MMSNDGDDDLVAMTALVQFFRGDDLGWRRRRLLSSAEPGAAAAAERVLTEEMLFAALTARPQVGRLNYVVQACTIALALPQILEPGEQITVRPSLGAGNDPSRRLNLETAWRIAELKAAQWREKDTVRKRNVVSDLVHLALDDSECRPQLYVVGARPVEFLRTPTKTVSWALGRSLAPHPAAVCVVLRPAEYDDRRPVHRGARRTRRAGHQPPAFLTGRRLRVMSYHAAMMGS